MNRKRLYLKILLVLVSGFLVSKIAINEIFVASTPRIRQNLLKYIASRIPNLVRFNDNKIAEHIEKTVFVNLSKGVYAKPLPKGGSYILIKENEIEWIEYNFDINGQQVKIKGLKGENPPPKEFVEKIYK